MATKKPATRRKAPARRPAARTSVTRRPPRGRSRLNRFVLWCARIVARHAARHTAVVRSRRDAAILRAAHEGCGTCHGTGTLYTKDKHGTFSGSKPCPAKPATMKISRTKVAATSRFGVDKNSGLIGWRCPCGAKEKPRYRDAKTATAALRTHERKRHGGTTVGGAWYAQLPEGTKPATASPAPPVQPVTKPAAGSGMTDQQWEAQNSPLSPATAAKQGKCWCCGGKGVLYSAFGGQQITAVCSICHGTGRPATAAAKGGTP